MIVLVVLVTIPAAGSVAFAQSNESNETTGNETVETNESSVLNESSADESEDEGGDEDDGSTPQVTIFDRGDNEPTLTREDVEGSDNESSGNESTGNESGDGTSGQTTLGEMAGEQSSGEDEDRSVVERPSPEGLTDKFIKRVGGVLYTGGMVVYQDIIQNGLGTAVPENDGYMGILGQPVEGDGSMYSKVYYDYYFVKIVPPLQDLFYLSAAITCFYIIPSGEILNYNTRKLGLMVIAGTVLVVASWEIATLMHWISDTGTQFLLPEADEMLREPGSEKGIATMESTSAMVGTLLGVSIFGWNAGMAMLVLQGGRHALLVPLPAWLGVIFIFQWVIPIGVTRKIGSLAFWGYVGLLVYNWPTAALIGAGAAIEYTFGMAGMSGVLADFGVTTGMFTIAAFLPVLTQATFFLAPLFAMYKKGSVANYGRSYARNRGWMDDNRRREQKGGGYAHPNRHHDRATTGRGRAVADGGSTTSKTPSGVGSTPSASGTPGVKSSRGSKRSKTSRRREIYNRIQRQQGQRFGEAKDGYNKS